MVSQRRNRREPRIDLDRQEHDATVACALAAVLEFAYGAMMVVDELLGDADAAHTDVAREGFPAAEHRRDQWADDRQDNIPRRRIARSSSSYAFPRSR